MSERTSPPLVCQGCRLSPKACTCKLFPAYLSGSLCSCGRRLIAAHPHPVVVEELCGGFLCMKPRGHGGECSPSPEVPHG